jgi:hypothetical protein
VGESGATVIDQIRQELKKITYKPGYEFTADNYGGTILITVTTPYLKNANGGNDVFISIRHEYCHSMPLSIAVRNLVRELELHEVDEWLKVDGKRIREPHGPRQETV